MPKNELKLPIEPEKLLEQAFSEANRIRTPQRKRVSCLTRVAEVYGILGMPVHARRILAAARQAAGGLKDADERARARHALALSYTQTGEIARAMGLVGQVPGPHQAWVRINAARYLACNGQSARAGATLKRAEARIAVREGYWASWTLAIVAELYCMLGKQQDAVRCLVRAERAAERETSAYLKSCVYRDSAEQYMVLGARESCLASLKKSLLWARREKSGLGLKQVVKIAALLGQIGYETRADRLVESVVRRTTKGDNRTPGLGLVAIMLACASAYAKFGRRQRSRRILSEVGRAARKKKDTGTMLDIARRYADLGLVRSAFAALMAPFVLKNPGGVLRPDAYAHVARKCHEKGHTNQARELLRAVSIILVYPHHPAIRVHFLTDVAAACAWTVTAKRMSHCEKLNHGGIKTPGRRRAM